MWLIESVPAWLPTRNRLRRLALAPVHQMVDPALAARLLDTTADGLLAGRSGAPSVQRKGSLLGALFESMVTLSVRVYAQACEARVYHLRTHGGEHEIDLIVQGLDGRVAAIEVKLAASQRIRSRCQASSMAQAQYW